jgi:plastocyanin
MRIPPIFLGLVLIVAGVAVPAIGNEPAPPADGAIGMIHEGFTLTEVTIHPGQTVTMVNSSRWLHIIGPGREGTLEEADAVPMHERALMETNDSYTTAAWRKPGTYYLTCSIHPEQTVKVVVTDCGCCSGGTCG